MVGTSTRVVRQHHLIERLSSLLSTYFGWSEPVELVEQRFNFLPRIFRWRGDVWRVRRVVRVWDYDGGAWQASRRYFQIICQEERSYVLFQDLSIGTWHLRRGGV